MFINAEILLFLFYCKYNEYGMKRCNVSGVMPINVTFSMIYSCYVQFELNDTVLSCICDITIDFENKNITIQFSPKNKFDIHTLILPGNQDPSIIQKTYNLLFTELQHETFNIKYNLTYNELYELHQKYIVE